MDFGPHGFEGSLFKQRWRLDALRMRQRVTRGPGIEEVSLRN